MDMDKKEYICGVLKSLGIGYESLSHAPIMTVAEGNWNRRRIRCNPMQEFIFSEQAKRILSISTPW